MTLEELLIRGDLLDAEDADLRLKLDYFIYEEEWVAMRQDLLDRL